MIAQKGGRSGPPRRSGLVRHGFGHPAEGLAQAGEALRAKRLLKPALHLFLGVPVSFERIESRLGEDDIFGAPVDRIEIAAHQTLPFELVERLLHGLFAEPHPFGQQRLRDARPVELGEDRGCSTELWSVAPGKGLVQRSPPGALGLIQQVAKRFFWAVKHLDRM